ncbi:prolyl aminopeptidase [Hyphomicrobium sulfonivorans]|uniref:prolyl aminopeptidase n=1 Tax=Hyphomicrobium sulfonivorans TaxID=121290 RepID=UPI0008394D8B|nr:prolyl aminopeptidase [Hyphomicrobium sulfonivorans]
MSSSSESQPLRPFDARMLDVGDGHWIYVEEVGRRDGVPALFLHGGPGSGSQHLHRRLFDPERHHALLFDQRGAGRSHPYLSLQENTTQKLIADIEVIRTHFGIERWIVVGGSWGSTLAVAYAEAHPERVAALALRAVFLGTRREVEWAFVEGPKLFRPELYADFVGALPEAERADPLAAYLERLADPDPKVHRPAAEIWASYERALSELAPGQSRIAPSTGRSERLPPTPFVEGHYIRNDFFLQPDQLVREASKLRGIPGVIVQGRYDLLCPPHTAYALSEAWGNCRLEMLDRAGHAISEQGVMEALTRAIRELTDNA